MNPSHRYGIASDAFGHDLSFQDANALIQRYNAPTRDALYGPDGNNPIASWGMISRLGARELDHNLDRGGNVTLEHSDGYAKNTTIDVQHPLEGTATRNLVVDLHEGGGYQMLTLGRGEGGGEAEVGSGESGAACARAGDVDVRAICAEGQGERMAEQGALKYPPVSSHDHIQVAQLQTLTLGSFPIRGCGQRR